jgi:glycosyltransferase involved in cell wall biosynthesis
MIKVAIVHDSFLYMGGAERVLLALLSIFPQADVYIPLIKADFADVISTKTTGRLNTSWLNTLPIPVPLASLLKPFIFYYWENLNLDSYELVISSSHSFSSKSVITHHPTFHLSYVHTPPRYLYKEYSEMRWLRLPLVKSVLAPLFNYLRKKDYAGAQRPNVLVANSTTVQQRIKKYYGRDSTVVYPPISLPTRLIHKQKSYYVCHSRLVTQKGIDIAVKACTQLSLDLLIIGTGPQEKKLRTMAGTTISFMGYVPDAGLAEIYAGAKALIYCSREEDFGMVPVEAMAHGVPVIAYNSGGVSETVINKKTGILFNKLTVPTLITAIKTFEKTPLSSGACRQRARMFDEKKFVQKLLAILPL